MLLKNAVRSLLVSALLVMSPIVSAAELVIYNTAEDAKPLQTGDALPDLVVQTVDGKDLVLAAGAREKPAMFITFRGGWCPYCNTHLSELSSILPELSDHMDVYFLSGDRPEILYSSLKEETQSEIDGLDYVIYSGASAQAFSALGVAFLQDPKMVERMKQRMDIDGSSIDTAGVLPVPAIFIVGNSGSIEFAYSNPDYKVRLPSEEVKAAAMAVIAGG